jgi:hypothetical protein
MGTLTENMEFEAEVRRVAEALFGAQPGTCQPEHYVQAGPLRELDGLLRLRDISHLFMVTTSTKLQKIKDDVKKLDCAAKLEAQTAPAIAKWVITERQLDAEHVGWAKKSNTTCLTLEQLRRRFFDGRAYLGARQRAPFGSARNLRDDTTSIPDGEYVPLPMHAEPRAPHGSLSRGTNPKDVSIEWIAERISSGDVVVLTAPYGSGKSLTTREVFLKLGLKYLKNESSTTPVVLNLREHWGQDDAEEILDRHAKKVGFDGRKELYSAWRAGMVALLIDGFDEVGSQVVANRDNKRFLAEARHRALKGARELIANRAKGCGVLICGRDHYFDSLREMENSLGISDARQYWVVRLGEFTDSGIADYLKRAGTNADVPSWLPRKPLLLAYLLHHQLLDQILGIDGDKGFGYVWDAFLDRICAREAMLEGAAMDSSTVRQVLEYLAQKVRSSRTGLGPITGLDLAEAYEQTAGEAPGDGVLPHLQRLPALSAISDDPGSRAFVDEDMLAALQGSVLASIVNGSFSGVGIRPLDCLRVNALRMSAYLCEVQQVALETVVAVAARIRRSGGRRDSSAEYSHPQLVADCVELALELAYQEERELVDFRGLEINGAILGTVRVDEIVPKNLDCVDCHIHELRLGGSFSSEISLKIFGGQITKVSGAASMEGLPAGMIDQACEIGEYDSLATNAAVLRSDLAPSMKALLTVLRKLYKQAGAGRKLSAFRRGITDTAVLDRIEDVINILQSQGMLRLFNQVAHPVRSFSARVDRILAGPTLSDDPICLAVIELEVTTEMNQRARTTTGTFIS